MARTRPAPAQNARARHEVSRTIKATIRSAGLWVAALGLALAAPAFAQKYPEKPIRLIVPFAAGGSMDVLGRLLGEATFKELKQHMIVDNRVGAGGTIGVGAVAAAAPDGYTLVLGDNGSLVYGEGLYKLNYTLVNNKDLRPVAMVGSAQYAVVVRSSLGVNTLQELARRSKQTSVSYGSPGVGSAGHLSGALFETLVDAKLVHVPYKGIAPALTDLEAGRIDVIVGNITSIAPFIPRGNIKAIAVTDEVPSPLLPGVPTVAAAGMPKFLMRVWYGVVGPGGMSNDVVATLQRAIAAALKDKEFLKILQARGFDPAPDASTAAFAELIKKDFDQWVPLIRKLGIEPN